MAFINPIEIIIRAKDQTKKAFKNINDGFDRLTKRAGRFAKVGLAGAATASSAGLIKLAESIDRVAKAANRLDIPVAELQKLQFAATQSGFGADQLTAALSRLQKRVSEAVIGIGEARNVLTELGLSAQELNNVTVDEKVKIIADALQLIPTAADRSRIALRLFGDDARGIENVLDGGREAIEAYGETLEDIGGTSSEEAAKGSQKIIDALDRVGAAARGAGSRVLAFLNQVDEGFGTLFDRLAGGGEVDVTTQAIKALQSSIVDLNVEIQRLKAESASGVIDPNIEAETSRLESVLQRHKETLASLINSEQEKNALKAREAEEARHNAQMELLRNAQNAAAQQDLKIREAQLQTHLQSIAALNQQQQSLIADINTQLGQIGQGTDTSRIDVLTKSLEAWQQLGIGNFDQVLSLVKEGLDSLADYESTGEDSASQINSLKESFKQLAEAAQEGLAEKTKEDVQAAVTEYEAFKNEVEGKPISALVLPKETTGQDIVAEAQRQIDQTNGVTIRVFAEFGGGTADISLAGEEDTAETLEQQSDKRGRRL